MRSALRRLAAWVRRDDFLDVPWGICVFLFVAVGGLVWTFASNELKAGDYLAAVSGGAGLLAVGHGIRQHGKETGRKDGSAVKSSQRSATTTQDSNADETSRPERSGNA
jgi:hypothetical protein